MTLVGPYIGSMRQWVNENTPLVNNDRQQINQPTRQLLLLEALKKHSHLFNQLNIWLLCDSLLVLFDELTSHKLAIDKPDLDDWTRLLQQAYGNEDISLTQLSEEACLVHTLWHAWQKQMLEMNICDSNTAYHQRLQQLQTYIPVNTCFYIICAEQLNSAETEWCTAIEQTHNVHYFVQGTPPPQSTTGPDDSTDAYHQFLHDAYNRQKPLAERKPVAIDVTEQIKKRLGIFSARQLEHEARAIDLQVRSWLLQEKNNIAIVSENRKLSRRVRALLERSGVSVQDTAGWSLSTTSAATIIERWLECIEEDFSHQPLLDLLKSPFFVDTDNRQQHLADMYRFEQDIILHENIPRDIKRYIRALDNRHNRTRHWSSESYDRIRNLLNHLQQLAEPLRLLYANQQLQTPDQFLHALLQSLVGLDIYDRLNSDSAGMRIIQELDKMQLAIHYASPSMQWQDFRTWLGRTLETEQFKPHTALSAVKLMNLQQAQYCTFDGLIIAAANKNSLPGTTQQTAFFNQSVRQSLGISNWNQDKEYSFYCFKNLLESAPEILISYQQEENGEWLQASPWVSALTDFASRVSSFDLENTRLQQLTDSLGSMSNCDVDELPGVTSSPAPVLDSALIATTFSASKHQRLIDCPYKFFATDGLLLKAPEQIIEELSKSDYGNRVHRILLAFHQQQPGLAPPFTEILTPENRSRAMAHMETLSTSIFSQDLEDTVQHRSWLKRWMKTAGSYIDWQIEHQVDWQIKYLEEKYSIEINPLCQLEGRLDRVDSANGKLAIIDYKTGTPPKQKDINSGEDVQLVSYAQLLDNVLQVEYLKLDGVAKVESSLDDETLEHIKQLSQQRLETMVNDIHQKRQLPAWGDEKSCRYCDLSGLCRKQMFAANSTAV